MIRQVTCHMIWQKPVNFSMDLKRQHVSKFQNGGQLAFFNLYLCHFTCTLDYSFLFCKDGYLYQIIKIIKKGIFGSFSLANVHVHEFQNGGDANFMLGILFHDFTCTVTYPCLLYIILQLQLLYIVYFLWFFQFDAAFRCFCALYLPREGFSGSITPSVVHFISDVRKEYYAHHCNWLYDYNYKNVLQGR